MVGFAGSSTDLNINLLKQRGIRDFISTREDLFVKRRILEKVSHCIDSLIPDLCSHLYLSLTAYGLVPTDLYWVRGCSIEDFFGFETKKGKVVCFFLKKYVFSFADL